MTTQGYMGSAEKSQWQWTTRQSTGSVKPELVATNLHVVGT